MNLTQKLLSFALIGAEWVLWLLIILSLFSVAVMIERGLYYRGLRGDFLQLADDLRKLLMGHKFAEARKRAATDKGPEAEVVRAGLEECERGAAAVESAMLGAKARIKLHLERNLAYLGTLGSNAPFIGLFGTVLGVIKAFRDLSSNSAEKMNAVLASIGEALIATAVGLLVAIPAVVAFNYFNRRVRAINAHIDSVAQVVLAALRAEREEEEREERKRGKEAG